MRALRKKSKKIQDEIQHDWDLPDDEKNTVLIIIIASVSGVVVLVGGVLGYLYFARWRNAAINKADPYTGQLTA